jgi:1-acyl-sn-glycerol-3-phosphate acyltransferase
MDQKSFDRFILFWANTMLALSGVRLDVRGLEHLKNADMGIIISNHASHMDIPILFSALPVSMRMVAKKELFKIPLFGWALRKADFLSVDRSSVSSAKQSMIQAQKYFEKGHHLWIAPEGTRFKGIGMGEFKMGAFAMATEFKKKIYPVVIKGSFELLPKDSFLVNMSGWSTTLKVSVLEPVEENSYSWENRKNLRFDVREKMLQEFLNL